MIIKLVYCGSDVGSGSLEGFYLAFISDFNYKHNTHNYTKKTLYLWCCEINRAANGPSQSEELELDRGHHHHQLWTVYMSSSIYKTTDKLSRLHFWNSGTSLNPDKTKQK